MARTLNGIESLPDLLAQRVGEERIYVHARDVLDLAAGATVLDFAYRIHTELGHTCTGGVIDGQWAPVRTPLKTGEQVEIISGGPVRPHRAWLESRLGFVRTHRAKASIAAFFRGDSQMKSARRGMSILQNVVAGVGASHLTQEGFELLAKELGYQDTESLFVATALGQQSYISLAHRVLSDSPLSKALNLWPEGSDGASVAFPTQCVSALPRKPRVCCDITTLLADQGLPIVKAAGELADEETAVITVEVNISDWLACLELLSHLSYLQSVVKVTRFAASQTPTVGA